jgi:hypothetical protein
VFAASIAAALTTATLTFATPNQDPEPPTETAAAEQPTLVVPDVEGQPYVFAKTTLVDDEFAWRVEGEVQGFAANLVARQRPAAGVQIVDTGNPTIVLELARNASYEEHGLPENGSPYPGTEVILAQKETSAQKETLVESAPQRRANATKPKPAPAETPGDGRRPAFQVPGAPAEPANEMPLTERAFLLASWLANQDRFTSRVERRWRYQHGWIVTGARFGWHGGAEALRVLLEVDRDVRARWGVGARELAVARAALREVTEKAKRRSS